MRSAQVESEAGGGFAQIGETGYPETARLRWDLYRTKDQDFEQDCYESATVLKQRGHKNGHNGHFSGDFRTLSIALSC